MTEYAHHIAFTFAVEQIRTRSAQLAERTAWASEAGGPARTRSRRTSVAGAQLRPARFRR
jgi:hypothetical protein